MNRVLLTTILLLTASTSFAQGRQGGASQLPQAAPATAARPIATNLDRSSTALIALIDRLTQELDQEIIYNPTLFRNTAVSSLGDDADLESLRGILRASNYVVVEIAGQLHIFQEPNARSLPTRVLNEDDRRVSDHEIVTRIITLPEPDESGAGPVAPMLVPILRPMMPQNAQLGALPNSNKLVLVDYYDNVRRMTEVIESLIED